MLSPLLMKNILSVNIGSSSIKFAIYPSHDGKTVDKSYASGTIEGLEPGGSPTLTWSNDGQKHSGALVLETAH